MKKTLNNNTIKIKWCGYYPPAKALKWKVFDAKLQNKKNKFKKLEVDLGLEEYCIEILKSAFEQNFSRFDAWIIKDTKYEHSYIKASEIYKRGVQYKINNHKKSIQYLRKGEYDIKISHLPDNDFVKEILKYKKNYFLIVDKNVFNKWEFLKLFPHKIIIHCSERTKNFNSVRKIITHIKQTKKQLNLILIGGGILLDVGGFAAYLINREFIMVPTTLLAMIDVCVGGKTGINFYQYGKNQVGAFYFPSKVLVFTNWLNTLKPQEILAGLCEAIKHALLTKNETLLKKLCSFSAKNIVNLDLVLLKQLITIKANIVRKDPLENSIRTVLNLGHTLAHALEAYAANISKTKISHGQAVGVGIIFSLILSKNLNIMKKNVFNSLIQILTRSEAILTKNKFLKKFPHYENNFNLFYKNLLKFLSHDKKNITNKNKTINFVLLKAQGCINNNNINYLTPVKLNVIKKSLKELNNYL